MHGKAENFAWNRSPLRLSCSEVLIHNAALLKRSRIGSDGCIAMLARLLLCLSSSFISCAEEGGEGASISHQRGYLVSPRPEGGGRGGADGDHVLLPNVPCAKRPLSKVGTTAACTPLKRITWPEGPKSHSVFQGFIRRSLSIV